MIEQAMHLKMEPEGFVKDRPDGIECWSFLHFINPVDIRIGETLYHAAHDACIFIPPNAPQYYLSTPTYPLYHNYVHFSMTDSLFFDMLYLPVNQIFYTNVSKIITRYIESICWKLMAKRKNLENTNEEFEITASNSLKELFKLLSEDLKTQRRRDSDTHPFKQLRELVYSEPKNWNVQKMAKYVYLSRSHFSVKYHELFNITPQEDLALAALNLAEKLLTTSKMSVMEIADECGFSSAEYFIRFFKKHRKITPDRYRKSL